MTSPLRSTHTSQDQLKASTKPVISPGKKSAYQSIKDILNAQLLPGPKINDGQKLKFFRTSKHGKLPKSKIDFVKA